MLAAKDFGAGFQFTAQTLRADGDATVTAHFQNGAHAPDVRPPRTLRRRAQHKTPFFFGEVPGGLRGRFYFTMDFLGVVMAAQFFEQRIGLRKGGDFFGGKKSGEPVLALSASVWALVRICFNRGETLHIRADAYQFEMTSLR